MSDSQHDFRLTLGYLTIDRKPLETIEVAAGAGYKAAGIRITGRRPSDPYAPILGNQAAVAEIGARARDLGVRISNVSAYHLYPDVTDVELRRICEATAGLGCDTIIVNNYIEDGTRLVECLGSYGALAKEVGLRIALEFVSFSATRSLGDGLQVIENVGMGNIGLMVDILHLDRTGGSPRDLVGVDPTLIMLAQVCDAPAEQPRGRDALLQEARYGRLYLGDGGLPLGAFLNALPTGCEIEVELPVVAAAHLSPGEKARVARDRTEAFLTGR